MTNVLSFAINMTFALLLSLVALIYMGWDISDLSMDHLLVIKHKLIATYYEMKL